MITKHVESMTHLDKSYDSSKFVGTKLILPKALSH